MQKVGNGLARNSYLNILFSNLQQTEYRNSTDVPRKQEQRQHKLKTLARDHTGSDI